MKKRIINSLVVGIVSIAALVLSLLMVVGNLGRLKSLMRVQTAYQQPQLPYGKSPWVVRSIDTQVISKHWPDVNKEFVHEQVSMLKELGVNYVAIGTPYDRVDDLKLWADEIHNQGMNVWFRSHWAEWEGDDGRPATMLPSEYLEKTKKLIIDNPDLFMSGDSFTVCVEAEQVGVGLGKRFLTWDDYRSFLTDEINIASEAFHEIGMEGKIYTNWLSMNGWVAENQLTKELTEKMGVIVVDHFVEQSETIGKFNNSDNIVDQTVKDLDDLYQRWGVPILLGEWGYQIHQPVNETLQAEVIDKMFRRLRYKRYLVGVNYWVHMGNTAAIISDELGTNLKFREGAFVIKSYYSPFSNSVDLNK